MRVTCLTPAIVLGLVLGSRAEAAVVVLEPSKDNTIFEHGTGGLSNGSGVYIFSGLTASNLLRRALLEFDVESALPPGSVVENVSLTLNVSRVPPGFAPRNNSLHRVTTEWGEGTSDAGDPGGPGAPAATGDATWIHASLGTFSWGAVGGDFAAIPSATSLIAGLGLYTWTSPQMVQDVQSWLDSPSDNQGWILLGNEGALQEARRYDSREHPTSANRPKLTIEYTEPVPAASTWGLAVLGLATLTAGTLILARRRAIIQPGIS